MAQVKCGNCSKFKNPVYHTSIADVKACYRQKFEGQGSTFTPDQYRQAGNNGVMPEDVITEASELPETDWLTTLDAIQRSWTIEEGENARSKREKRPSDIQRGAITEFLAKFETDKRTNKQIARFAIESPEDSKLRFLVVEMIDDSGSQWDGWTFVKVNASDEQHKLGHWRPGTKQTYKGVSHTLIRSLASLDVDGLYEAMVRYGHEIGSCGVCGRTLTDEQSRAAGIGPICAGKLS